MSKKKHVQTSQIRTGHAPPHGTLVNNFVHVFVDDQNLFWGIVNNEKGPSFRVDFGRLLSAAGRDSQGVDRATKTAFIAGVIPDDDSFWKIAEHQGFTVKRGFLGVNNRSKQDDAYLITELTSTLYEEQAPSTIVLVAGDADYGPPLEKAIAKGWRVEVAFAGGRPSSALDHLVHQFRVIKAIDIQYIPGIR